MVYDPVKQGHDKYNSFLCSVFILRADASGTEILAAVTLGVAIPLFLHKITAL